ncbi:hypothetical protein [Allokutzneria multivorans]
MGTFPQSRPQARKWKQAAELLGMVDDLDPLARWATLPLINPDVLQFACGPSLGVIAMVGHSWLPLFMPSPRFRKAVRDSPLLFTLGGNVIPPGLRVEEGIAQSRNVFSGRAMTLIHTEPPQEPLRGPCDQLIT